MSNPTTPFNWQMPQNTDLVTDLPADFEVFGQAVATSMQDLLGGTTGQVLAKASNADMDFVWSADAAGMSNPMTTTGDVIYSSPGSTPVRLGIGTANQVLRVNSGATAPEWATPATAGGMTLITEQVLSSSTGYQFTGLGSYKQLLLIWGGLTQSGSGDWDLRLNNNSSTVYNTAGLGAYNTTVWQNQASGDSLCAPSNAPLFTQGGYAGASLFYEGMGELYIDNYTSATKLKRYWGFTTFRDNPDNSKKYMTFNGIFNDVSAITTLDIVRLSGTATMSNETNTSIRLYGIS